MVDIIVGGKGVYESLVDGLYGRFEFGFDDVVELEGLMGG